MSKSVKAIVTIVVLIVGVILLAIRVTPYLFPGDAAPDPKKPVEVPPGAPPAFPLPMIPQQPPPQQ